VFFILIGLGYLLGFCVFLRGAAATLAGERSSFSFIASPKRFLFFLEYQAHFTSKLFLRPFDALLGSFLFILGFLVRVYWNGGVWAMVFLNFGGLLYNGYFYNGGLLVFCYFLAGNY